MIQLAEALPLSDKVLELHLQRLVGAFIGSAFGAGEFYSNKVSEARDLTAKLANEDRDEDRDGVSGFESKAERARLFAAEKACRPMLWQWPQKVLSRPMPISPARTGNPITPPSRRRDGQPDECLCPARRLRIREGRAGLRSRLPSLNFPAGNTAGEKAGLAITAASDAVFASCFRQRRDMILVMAKRGVRTKSPEPIQLPLFPESVSLCRIRPELNEWRYYRIDVWPDLFGRALLVKRWGRIGTEGSRRLESYADAGPATNALARVARSKQRRGYRLR